MRVQGLLAWSNDSSRGLETGVAGSRLARTCKLALRRCASKIWVPCRGGLDGMENNVQSL